MEVASSDQQSSRTGSGREWVVVERGVGVVDGVRESVRSPIEGGEKGVELVFVFGAVGEI